MPGQTDIANPILHSGSSECSVIELRQYRLHPGTRDRFLALFDQQFLKSQELLGSWVLGQFRDIDDPDRVVWLRGFSGMPERADALTAFYTGPVWLRHRDAANACIVDSDNVLLLRPAFGSTLPIQPRPSAARDDIAAGLVVVTIYQFDAPVDDDFLAFFEQQVRPALLAAGARVRAALVTESRPNNFRLPVREGEHVFVWWTTFADRAAYQRYAAALTQAPQWRDAIAEQLRRRLISPPEILRLAATARSRLQA